MSAQQLWAALGSWALWSLGCQWTKRGAAEIPALMPWAAWQGQASCSLNLQIFLQVCAGSMHWCVHVCESVCVFVSPRVSWHGGSEGLAQASCVCTPPPPR